MVDKDNFSTLPADRIKNAGLDGAELGILDKENPRSVYNLFNSKRWRANLDRLTPDDFSLSEQQLRKLAGNNAEMSRIRHMFWEEYNRAQFYNDRMRTERMGLNSVMSFKTFYKTIEDKHKLIYILTPPTDYQVQVREGLSHGLERVREILDLDIVDPVSKAVNPKIAVLILNAVKFLDARANGAFVQKNINYNVGPGASEDTSSKPIPTTVSELDEKIAEIESKLKKPNKDIPSGIVGVPMNDVAEDALDNEDNEF